MLSLPYPLTALSINFLLKSFSTKKALTFVKAFNHFGGPTWTYFFASQLFILYNCLTYSL